MNKQNMLEIITQILNKEDLHNSLVQFKTQIEAVYSIMISTENEPNTYNRSIKLAHINQTLSNEVMNCIILAYQNNISYNDLYQYTLPNTTITMKEETNINTTNTITNKEFISHNILLQDCNDDQLNQIANTLDNNQQVIYSTNKRAIPLYNDNNQNVIELEDIKIICNPTSKQLEYIDAVKEIYSLKVIKDFCDGIDIDIDNKHHIKGLQEEFKQYDVNYIIKCLELNIVNYDSNNIDVFDINKLSASEIINTLNLKHLTALQVRDILFSLSINNQLYCNIFNILYKSNNIDTMLDNVDYMLTLNNIYDVINKDISELEIINNTLLKRIQFLKKYNNNNNNIFDAIEKVIAERDSKLKEKVEEEEEVIIDTRPYHLQLKQLIDNTINYHNSNKSSFYKYKKYSDDTDYYNTKLQKLNSWKNFFEVEKIALNEKEKFQSAFLYYGNTLPKLIILSEHLKNNSIDFKHLYYEVELNNKNMSKIISLDELNKVCSYFFDYKNNLISHL